MRHLLVALPVALVLCALATTGPHEALYADTRAPRQDVGETPESNLRAHPTLCGRAKARAAPLAVRDEPDRVHSDFTCLRRCELPPDPITRGTATLHLAFFDADTNLPVETGFALWRLDVAGTRDWARGDQLQAKGRANETGVLLRALPEGTYRVQVFAARRGAEEAPAFVVGGTHTTQRIAVDRPTNKRAHVIVFDERGGTVLCGTRQHLGHHNSGRDPDAPDWVAERHLTGDRARLCIWGGWSDGPSRHAYRTLDKLTVHAGLRGFELGEHMEATRFETTRHDYCLRFDDRSRLAAGFDTSKLSAPTLVGIAVPMAWIRARIRLPDYRLLTETAWRVEAYAKAARPTPDATDFETAAHLPIHVTIWDGERKAGTATLRLDSGEARMRPVDE